MSGPLTKLFARRQSRDLPKGNLFDEAVLRKYSLSWLPKPKTSVRETQYTSFDFSQGCFAYCYGGIFSEKDECEGYIGEIFSRFVREKYTVGSLLPSVDLSKAKALPVLLSDDPTTYVRTAEIYSDEEESTEPIKSPALRRDFYFTATPKERLFSDGRYLFDFPKLLSCATFGVEEGTRLVLTLCAPPRPVYAEAKTAGSKKTTFF